MLEKIKDYQPKAVEFVKSLQDVQTLGLLMFLVAALLISWSGIKVIETNYGLQKDISRLQQENEVRKLENRNLELENEYYKTDEYLDLEARRNFGMAAPGEAVLVVPKKVAMKHVVPPPTPLETEDPSQANKPKYLQNLDAWKDFLLHKNL